MKKIVAFLLIAVQCAWLSAQVNFSGRVESVVDHRPVAGVTIHFKNANIFAISDSAGAFSIALSDLEIPVVSHIAFNYVTTIFTNEYNNDSLTAERVMVILMEPRLNLFEAITITGNRAELNAPVTYTNIKGSTLAENNFGEDMPFLLEQTPSAVVTSDAGNGVGYTGLRIRGSDATRVNVSINGVPYNDAESEQTYWVDLADIAESVDDIQIQRGVGTSSYGISSLGAAVNIYTNRLHLQPYANISGTLGSFNLMKESVSFGTGKLKDAWTIEGRFSKLNSDGFIDRSFADLASYFITAGYDKSSYHSYLNVFSTKEKTYQSWGGVPAEILDTNRTYNPYTYENQTDNYTQTHFQWHNILDLNAISSIQISLNYTKGNGYYEQLETDQLFADYNAADPVVGGDTITTSDMITQKWLDNYYAGAFMQYKLHRTQLNFLSGAAYYRYDGDHFGKVIWSEYAETLGPDYQWYINNAIKQDGNIFANADYSTEKFIFMADLQLRNVQYAFIGPDAFGNETEQSVSLLFFNPKFGITWKYSPVNNFYLFIGKSSKEPNRDDYVESSPESRPDAETLYDLELGERLRWKGWQFNLNYYYMYYQDQLVLTGEINDVGAYTRTNIPVSYRTGLELAWSKIFHDKLFWSGNVTFSKNIISDYTEFVDNWDDGSQQAFDYSGTTIAFSPSVIAADQIKYILLHKTNSSGSDHTLSVIFLSKYVSKQFADNTENDSRSLDAYMLHDLSFTYKLVTEKSNTISCSAIVQNIFNTEYESNAWVYRYLYENAEQQMMGYYPQAGINWALSFRLEF